MAEERTHPAAYVIEEWHAGERSPTWSAHIEACPSCQERLDALAAEREEFLAREEPADYVRRVRRRVEVGRAARPRWWRWAAPLGAALAVALVIVVLRPWGAAAPDVAPPAGTTLKGGSVQVAVVRERAGVQTRHAEGMVQVWAGDRIRVELTVAEELVLTVGVLEGGQLAPLAAERRFSPGTHHLEPALRVGDPVQHAEILVGPHEAVLGWVGGRASDAVVRLAIRPEGPR